MAFPSDPLGTRVELKINGTWTNAVRYDTNTKIIQKDGITIKRGQSGLEDRTKTGSATWTWQDPNGIYNNENPRSPYYNLLGRNTPVRIAVPRSETALLLIDKNDGGRAQTTDKAALDITGDLEIRLDFEPNQWTRWGSGANRARFLSTKYLTTGNQRSWYVRYGDPTASGSLAPLAFVWSVDGTSGTTNIATATAPLPTTGRIAVKITFDASNGGGVAEVRFYTSTTGIDGTYTQLGSAVTFGAASSIFSGTANVELGTMNNGGLDGTFGATTENYVGRIYGFRLYNGIGGTLVANADFSAQTSGITSFADGLGNTWTLGGSAEITNADYRFHGELSAPKIIPKKSSNGTGIDVAVQVDCGGLIRRLAGNDSLVSSAIARTFDTYGANGWWPGEDASGTDTVYASSRVSGAANASITDITFDGFDSGIAGSAGVMECGTTAPSFTGYAKAVDSTGECHFYAFFKYPSVPAGDTILFTWYSNSGEAAKYTLTVGSAVYRLQVYDFQGTEQFSTNTLHGTGGAPDRWIAYHSRTSFNGPNIEVTHEWHTVGTDLYFSGAVGTIASGSIGRFTKVVLQGSSLAGVKFCHPMVSNTVGLRFYSGTPTTNVVNYARAFSGELADSRFRRIGGLMGIETVVVGQLDNSEPMGPEPIDTALNILYEIPEVDGGIIVEARDQLALEYHTRKALYNQTVSLPLDYAHLAKQLESTADDTDIANDIVMKRSAGGEARATLVDGKMSIQAPPNGINPVPDSPEVNNATLARLPDLAYQYLLTHTWPTSRYPEINVQMQHPNFAGNAERYLLTQKLDIGKMLSVSDMPLFMAPDTLQLLVRGVTEEIGGQEWDITWDTVPYGAYVTSELGTVADDPYTGWVAGTHTIAGVVQTQLNSAINDSTTSLSVKTLSGPLLKTGSVNYSIKIDGEIMLVTNVTGTTSPQTVTVTRGTVGGYAASHSADAYIILYPPLKARL